jgi:hypothetical protein
VLSGWRVTLDDRRPEATEADFAYAASLEH